ncbi:MAG: hypothetical protein RL441_1373 [Actinomycetota bacterium]
MNISARVDYGMRALLHIAGAYEQDPKRLVKADEIARGQGLPIKFLEGILGTLRTAGIIISQRGAEGGYRLAHSPSEITVAKVVRALDGPLAAVRGERPEEVEYVDSAEHLKDVWVATRAALRNVLENVTLHDILAGELPTAIKPLLEEPGAWQRRI